MAVSISERVVFARAGHKTLIQCKINLNTYATNGVAVTASDFGLKYLHHISPGISEGGYGFAYDDSAGKIKAFEAGADAGAFDEVADMTDLSGEHYVALVSGVGIPNSDV